MKERTEKISKRKKKKNWWSSTRIDTTEANEAKRINRLTGEENRNAADLLLNKKATEIREQRETSRALKEQEWRDAQRQKWKDKTDWRGRKVNANKPYVEPALPLDFHGPQTELDRKLLSAQQELVEAQKLPTGESRKWAVRSAENNINKAYRDEAQRLDAEKAQSKSVSPTKTGSFDDQMAGIDRTTRQFGARRGNTSREGLLRRLFDTTSQLERSTQGLADQSGDAVDDVPQRRLDLESRDRIARYRRDYRGRMSPEELERQRKKNLGARSRNLRRSTEWNDNNRSYLEGRQQRANRRAEQQARLLEQQNRNRPYEGMTEKQRRRAENRERYRRGEALVGQSY